MSAGGIKAGKAFLELSTDATNMERGLHRAEGSIRKFGATVSSIGMVGFTAASAAIGAIVSNVHVFGSMGSEMEELSLKTGMSVEMLSEMKHVLAMSGVSVESFEVAVKKMNSTLNKADQKGGSKSLESLGLSIKSLMAMSPEDRFMTLAEALSKVSDSGRKSALAVEFFGRGGTKMLPMLADGADGIQALREEAEKLGLTMSGESAASAYELERGMKTLWEQLKMVSFQIGAELAPYIMQLINRAKEILSHVRAWVHQNAGLIISTVKLLVAIAGVSLAVMVLGEAIQGLSFIVTACRLAVGVTVAAFTLMKTTWLALAATAKFIKATFLTVQLAMEAMSVSSALAMDVMKIGMKGALGGATALLNPWMLLAGVVAAAAVAVVASQVDWATAWKRMKDDTTLAWGGITAAIQKGDLQGAIKIVWLLIQLEWYRATGTLSEITSGWWHDWTNMWTDIIYGVKGMWQAFCSSIAIAFSEIVAGVMTTWGMVSDFWQSSLAKMQNIAAKAWAVIKSVFNDDINVGVEFGKADSELRSKLAEIDKGVAERQARSDALGAKSVADATKDAAALEQEYADAKQGEEERYSADLNEIQKKIDGARGTLEKAVADTKAVKEETVEKRKRKDYGGGDNLPEKIAGSAVGTFDSFIVGMIGRMGGGGVAERTAAAAERTAEATEEMNDKLDDLDGEDERFQ